MHNDQLENAMRAHREWVIRFDSALTRGDFASLDPQQLRNDRCCEFGRWLDANVEAFVNHHAFECLAALHRTFHEIAAEVAEMTRDGYPDAAIEPYREALVSLSSQLLEFEAGLQRSWLIGQAA